MATIVGDLTGLQQGHHPYHIPHLVKKIKGFLLKVKWFQNTATYQKLKRGSIPPPLYHGGGMNLRVRPRVNNTFSMPVHARPPPPAPVFHGGGMNFQGLITRLQDKL